MEWGIAQETVMVELVETGRGNVADGLLPTLRVTFKTQMSEHAKTSDAYGYLRVSLAQAGQLVTMQRGMREGFQSHHVRVCYFNLPVVGGREEGPWYRSSLPGQLP